MSEEVDSTEIEQDFSSDPELLSILSEDEGQEATEGQAPATDTPAPRADGRDDLGRFVPQGKDQAAPQDPATPSVAQAETSNTSPAAIPPASAATPPVVDPNAPAVDTAPTVEPFVVRYGNADYEIPGSQINDTHILIPREQHELVREYIGNGIKFKAEKEQIRQEKLQQRQINAEQQALNKGFETEAAEIIRIAALPSEEDFALQLLEYGLKMRQDLPNIEAKRELAKREAALALREQMGQPEPEERLAQEDQAAEQALQQHFSAMLQQGLTEEDTRDIEAQVRANPSLVFYRVGQNPTPQEQAAGVRPGELVISGERLSMLARPYARSRQVVKQEQERAKKLIEENQRVANENARKLAQPSPTRSTGTPDEPAKRETAKPKSYEEFKDSLEDQFRAVLAEG